MQRENPREIAVNLLSSWERTGIHSEIPWNHTLDALSPADRKLCHEVVNGIVRHRTTLHELIRLKTPHRPPDPIPRILLSLGLYQLFYLDRIPDHALVHETVQLAKHLGFSRQAGFINAILRAYLRERQPTLDLLQTWKTSQPALGYSQPQWMVDRWTKHFGSAQTQKLLEWNNTPPPIYARLNSLVTDSHGLLKQWKEENVQYDFVSNPWHPNDLVFTLHSPVPFPQLPSFQKGYFYLQDPSTLLAPHLLNPQSRENILDLCAAPGGKTTYLAQLTHNQARIIAQDNDSLRLKKVEENLLRLHVTSVETSRPDDIPFPELSLQFDRILVDAPCSNTGVLRRRVELRWRLKPADLPLLQAQQLQLLHHASRQLKPQGILVYSTCSIEPEENQILSQQFLQQHPAYSLLQEQSLFPFQHGVDGAYVAVFQNNSPT